MESAEGPPRAVHLGRVALGQDSHGRSLEIQRHLVALEGRSQRETERRQQLEEPVVGDHGRQLVSRALLRRLLDEKASRLAVRNDIDQRIAGRAAPGRDVGVDGGERVGHDLDPLAHRRVVERVAGFIEDERRDGLPLEVQAGHGLSSVHGFAPSCSSVASGGRPAKQTASNHAPGDRPHW